jgi:hypothetical protein
MILNSTVTLILSATPCVFNKRSDTYITYIFQLHQILRHGYILAFHARLLGHYLDNARGEMVIFQTLFSGAQKILV